MLDASDVVSTAASSMEVAVVVMMIGQGSLRMRKSASALLMQPVVHVGTDDTQSAVIESMVLTLRAAPKRPKKDSSKQGNDRELSDAVIRLEALLKLICAKMSVSQGIGAYMPSLDPSS